MQASINLYNPSQNGQILATPVLLQQTDIPAVMQLQQQRIKQIENTQTYYPVSQQEFLFSLQSGGMLLGLYWQTQLVAVCGVIFPGNREDNLAKDLNLPKQAQMQTAHIEVSLVAKDFCGQGIHSFLIGQAIQRLKEEGRAKYVFATISPFNLPSLSGALKNGMIIYTLSKKYNELYRYIVGASLLQPQSFLPQQPKTVLLEDLQTQQQLFLNGYRACRLIKQPLPQLLFYR